MNQFDLTSILPLTILTVWACVLLLVDLLIPKDRKSITALLSALGLAVTLGYTLSQIGSEVTGFNGMVTLDGFSIFVNALLLISGLLGVALAYGYVKRMGIERGEYYTLLLFSVVGMMLMAQATDLIVVFLALELLSIPLYVLAAFARPNTNSEEAGLKYFLLGAFSSGFLVYGIALIFGATHTTNIFAIVESASSSTGNLLLTIGAALLLIGFGFKVAAVPFHMWTPDVYQGAPTAVTAFMASGAKIAGFAALLRVFVTAFPSLAIDMTDVFWALSALTMIVGNFVAISQTDIKRLLAYSSIAHAGYILMAFVPYGNDSVVATSVAAGLFYLVAYVFTNFGAWGVVIALEKEAGNPSTGSGQRGLALNDYAGLSKRHPALAAAMAVFMISLIGFPPTLGMVGKFYLFRAVLDGGFVWLAIIGVLTSIVSAFYYLRVVVIMYMKDGEPTVEREPWLDLTTAVTALVTVVVSLVPQFLFAWASEAVLKLF
ncbi:MAG: NADH-quinone oxidoreductase subunit N [Anaerolineales bacterium]|nr:NADH-quinone oxidoreductase subunit N [Anaerolineales bacterium]